MNYCDKIRYRIYTTDEKAFPAMVDDLLDQLPPSEPILRLAFFGAPPSNEEYLLRHSLLKDKVAARYGNSPALSYVSQPPLNAPLILEVHSITPDEIDHIAYKRSGPHPYVLLENNDGRFLFAGGFQSDITRRTIRQQAREVFSQIGRLLEEERFPVRSIIRQWNYIEQITRIQDGNQNYQSFNNAREAFYGPEPWPGGYPAATGIGTNLGGVLVDFDAALFTSPAAFATSINNPLQTAAHAYSESVLKTAHAHRATPKFERAKSLTFGSRRLVYISGTAAIRGEESPRDASLEQQLHLTMENIAQLTGAARPVLLRVYLKEKAHYAPAQRLMDACALAVPVSYMYADVCRDELLIEIEGVAIE
ncbi:MAG: endoribonuclease L-PSP [Tannerellaceae bacterium]|jgi:enamine deaminase RidA (YjgF/YER057c/UK114 family)|nr:endoribonuclease L-PSP [Tannerellaceae bacterium]